MGASVLLPEHPVLGHGASALSFSSSKLSLCRAATFCLRSLLLGNLSSSVPTLTVFPPRRLTGLRKPAEGSGEDGQEEEDGQYREHPCHIVGILLRPPETSVAEQASGLSWVRRLESPASGLRVLGLLTLAFPHGRPMAAHTSVNCAFP